MFYYRNAMDILQTEKRKQKITKLTKLKLKMKFKIENETEAILNSLFWQNLRFQHNRSFDSVETGQSNESVEFFDASFPLPLSLFGHFGHSFCGLFNLNIFSLAIAFSVINDQSIVSTKHSAGFFSIRTEPRAI